MTSSFSSGSDLQDSARAVMEANWKTPAKQGETEAGSSCGCAVFPYGYAEFPYGYACPNSERYPWLWLWDSCFHAIIWAKLGEDERATTEIETLLAGMQPSGFLPHMHYVPEPQAATEIWGRSGFSSITQPPMFGHSIAELTRRGIDIAPETIEKAALGLKFFLRERLHPETGLVRLCHPWESGADDSPRWDGYYSAPYKHSSWQNEKMGFLKTIQRSPSGDPRTNPAFNVASPSFTALLAFNITELAESTGAIDAELGKDLPKAVASQWDEELGTWVDTGSADLSCRGAPTLDALLCLIADRQPQRVEQVCQKLFSEQEFGAAFGPAGVSRQWQGYDPDGYWRGAAWPQLTYLLSVFLDRLDRPEEANILAAQLRNGALVSGFAEYWNPDSATPGGAVPQSWAALGIVV